FSASGGQLSAGNATTNKGGQASVDFSCGTIDKSNRIVTIEASVEGLVVKQIPIQIIGTTVNVTSNKSTSLNTDGEKSDNITITVKDASGNPIYNAAVSMSINPSSTGSIIVSPESGNCKVDGTFSATVTAVSAGSALLNIAALGATSSITYTIGASIDTFAIQSPTENPVNLSLGSKLPITVFSPMPGSSKIVVFATTFGAWEGSGTQIIEVPIGVSSTATANLQSLYSGIATVQVYDKDSPSINQSITVAISAPTSTASQIELQSNSAVVAPSTGDTKNTAVLTATVRTVDDQSVGFAPVIFSIINPGAGGAMINPAVVNTDANGIARATFTSGAQSSDAEGIQIQATIVGTTIKSELINIVVGGTVGSIVIGTATKIENYQGNTTTYQYKMSILVSDTNGNPVDKTKVYLNIWPTEYALGYWTKVEGKLLPVGDREEVINEDSNFNLMLDGGEDLNGDGVLTPPSSSAGNVPAFVETDENGVANFNLIYLKQYAAWVKVKITATTIVFGSENRSELEFWHGWMKGEEESLSDSPF
ncbi:MAG: hypothetical protein C0403_01580, partial [Desulfobacterium sp.]|nr:hypothetical protein [Desulfobacterium sp.]